MQISVNEENWSNFRDSLNSDLTRQIYEQCLDRFLLYCDSDLESMEKLEPQKITNLRWDLPTSLVNPTYLTDNLHLMI